MKASELQVADVILSTTAAVISTIIKKGTLSHYSHAMLYAGAGKVVEAVGEGVVWRSIKDATRDALYAHCYRLKGLTAEKANRMVEFAKSKAGGAYAMPGVLGGSGIVAVAAPGLLLTRYGVNRIKTAVGGKRSYFCSELVEDAYESESLTVSRYWPSMTNPGDIGEYSERNPETFPKIGEIELPPDMG
jgi:hypothetical protein